MAALLNKSGSFRNVIKVRINVNRHCSFPTLEEINHKNLFYSSNITLFKRHFKSITNHEALLQARLMHTDLFKVPDFSKYRKDGTVDSHVKTNEIDRRVFSYVAVFGASVLATMTAKEFIVTALGSMGPNAKTMAEASVEVDLSNIPEGKNAVIKWRSKPLFVKHRTAEEIEREAAVSLTELRDPQTDLERVQRPEWLVLVGVCTHLGCVPIANSGDYHGYYCPCHGSHYDGSGRIRRGPAPENLEVPQYKFLDDKTIVVG